MAISTGYSLAEVVALKVSAGLECRKCHKFAAIDVDDLTRRGRQTEAMGTQTYPRG